MALRLVSIKSLIWSREEGCEQDSLHLRRGMCFCVLGTFDLVLVDVFEF